MATRTLTGDENVEDDETFVDSAQTEEVTATLPEVNDGSSATVAVGTEIRFQATGGAPIKVETFDGRLVGRVPGRGEAVVVARAGKQESETDEWAFFVLANTPSAHQSISGTPSQSEVQALRNCLVAHGLMKAE